MATLVTRIASTVTRRYLSADYEHVFDELRSLQNSGLTYSTRENPILAKAVLAAEDRYFYRHSGFHLRSIVRAAYVYIARRQLQGASTIEQQLVRVVRNRNELTMERKISEIFLATTLAEGFEKDTIIEMYMEVAYFGWKGTGIKQICNRLDIEVNSMSTKEASTIASLIKLPMPRAPSATYLGRQRARAIYIDRVMARDRRGNEAF